MKAFTLRATCLAMIAWLNVASAFAMPTSDRDSRDTTATATPFSISDVEGKKLVLAEKPTHQLTVICFLGTECPLAKLYAGRLQTIANDFSNRDVRFLAINSNRQDSAEELKQFIVDQQIKFPCGKRL